MKQSRTVIKQRSEQAIRPTVFLPKTSTPPTSSAKKIFDSFSPQNFDFVLRTIRGILSLTDLSSDGRVHYKLQSPPGQLLMNERQLLKKLESLGLFKNYGEDGIFAIATLGYINTGILKKLAFYLSEATDRPKTRLGKGSSEIEERYNQTIKEIASSLKSFPLSQTILPRSEVGKVQNALPKPTKRELRKMVTHIINNRKFGKKEKSFLKFLAKDFEPKTISQISREIPTKACKALKARVQLKMKGTGFIIDTIRANEWDKDSQYLLKFLTSPATA